MTILNQENTEPSLIADNTDVTFNCGDDNKTSDRITAPGVNSPPSLRKKKVFEIRRQVIEGSYDIDKGLDIALDRLIEDLIARDRIS